MPENYVPTCDECENEYTDTYGESALYSLSPDCYEEAVKEGTIDSP